MSNSYQKPDEVYWGWFHQVKLEREYKGWITSLPKSGSMRSAVKDYPGIEFRYYWIKDGDRGIYAASKDVLIWERHTAKGRQVQVFRSPKMKTTRHRSE